MKPVLSPKRTWRDVMRLDAAPERVFPLLCPVLEYDWIEDWKCDLLHSVSGVAEEGCIFRTYFAEGPMTWIVTRYEAPWRIEFACFVPGSHSMRLKLDLAGSQAGTTLNWVREFTATDPAGETWVHSFPEAQHRAMMERLEKMLKHYLATGELLRLQAPEAHSEQ